MRVNEKIKRITPETLICGIDIGKTAVIIAFEPTGHYWLNIDKYFKDCGQETVLMPTYTVKQGEEMHDQNPTKSDPKDALLIARLTSDGTYRCGHK